MTSSPIRGAANRLCLTLSALAGLPAATAHADCADDLVQQVFAHHAASQSFDSKLAMQAWFCEGASDAFLSQQPTLPTGTDDVAGWTTLLDEITPDTEVSPDPVGSTDVAQFRTDNCPAAGGNRLIHALGRVATDTEFDDFQACHAAEIDAANNTSPFFDLNLACSGQQRGDGTLELSVQGFHADHANAVSDLGNLVFTLDNLTAVEDYTTATIASGEAGLFEFSVDDPTLDASVSMEGAADTEFGPVFYYCDIEVGDFFSTSTPYVVGPEAECAFEPPIVGTTECPNGTLEQACIDGRWQDTDTCVVQNVDLNITTTSRSGGTGSVRLPDGSDCDGSCTFDAQQGSEVRLVAVGTNSSQASWTGCDSVVGDECFVQMDAARSVSVEFTGYARLTVNMSGTSTRRVRMPSGEICSSSPCVEFVERGTTAALKARPMGGNTGMHNVYWSGCTSSDNRDCSVQMTSNRTINLTMNRGQFLRFEQDGPGDVRMPDGSMCESSICFRVVDFGRNTQLVAVPSAGHRVQWTGCDSTSGNTCNLRPNDAVEEVSAKFVRRWPIFFPVKPLLKHTP